GLPRRRRSRAGARRLLRPARGERRHTHPEGDRGQVGGRRAATLLLSSAIPSRTRYHPDRSTAPLRPDRLLVASCLAALLAMASACPATAVTGNGRLQIHHIDVVQAHRLPICSPLGQTGLVEDGGYTACT